MFRSRAPDRQCSIRCVMATLGRHTIFTSRNFCFESKLDAAILAWLENRTGKFISVKLACLLI